MRRQRARVLATDIDPETIRPKRVYRRNCYFARNDRIASIKALGGDHPARDVIRT